MMLLSPSLTEVAAAGNVVVPTEFPTYVDTVKYPDDDMANANRNVKMLIKTGNQRLPLINIISTFLIVKFN